ncbi:hypothetical protein vseg_014328 [Gypsophila vaccaria]
MKKIFFSKSSSSNGGENSRDKKAKARNRTASSQNAENKFPICGSTVTETKTVFRRSRSLSMSSAAKERGRFSEEDMTRLRNHQRFPSSHGLCDCSDCQLQLRDRGSKPERYNMAITKRRPVEALHNHASSSPSNPSSPRNSFDSTSFSDQVLDLYIDGDHLQEKLKLRNHRFFVEESNLFIPSHNTSRDTLTSEHLHESPRKLAKDVVQRLQRLEQFRDSNLRENCLIWPPMSANVCDKHLDDVSGDGCTLKDILDEDTFATSNQSSSHEIEHVTIFPEEKFNATDSSLRRKLEEVKQKATQLSKELSQDRSFRLNTNNVSALSEMIRNLIEEERNLVVELSDHLQCRLAERAAAKEAALLLKKEMNSTVLKQARENDEFNARLRRELDRRSDEWESKVNEFKSEEYRLKDRLRELADQNACLQREISGLCNKEEDYTTRISHMEANLKSLIDKLDETRTENENLQQKLSDVKEKLEVSEEVQSCLERNFREKETENTELIKATTRLRGTCSEQERTIDGLRQCLNSEIRNKQTSDKLQNVTHKLLAEQLRLTEVEQVLRRKLETCTVEVQSLRTENIYLLERLKAAGKVSGRSVLKLDQELVSSIQCLKKTGLSLLNDSVQTCEDLLKIIRRTESQHGIQYEMKVQGLKHSLEQLTRSLGKTSFVLTEKPDTDNLETEVSTTENRRWKDMNQVVIENDDLRSELKAESLLTSILKEKLYSKEHEIERLQAELARALGSHDALKREIQDAFDTVSCLNHKMKNFELQIIQKDGTINQLQVEMQTQEEELGTTKTTLSKVTQERDLMWEEVKRYSENNMLLNRELTSLKKKIDTLEEDTLLKDGQISILKDSLSNARTFDVLFGVEQGELFKLQ